MSPEESAVVIALHHPDGHEISPDGYERQPIDLAPDPDAEDIVLNESTVEFPPFDSRVTVGTIGIYRDDELLATTDLYRDYTIEAGATSVLHEGQLEIARDDLPPGLV